MILETLAKLQSAFALDNQSLARRQLALLDAEHNLTPLEFHQVAGDLRDRFANVHAALQSLHLSQLLANEAPTRYVRRRVAPDVTLFHDPNVSCANKCIIIGFCGRAQRLMIPTGVFLQLLPSTDCDVVVLNDPRQNSFLHGSREYAADFFQLVSRLDKDVKPDRYKNVFCYGTSMGGFVALRCGLLLGTKSISVGGRFPWQVRRLLEPTGSVTVAFELLCACKASDAAEFVCVYGEQSAADVAAVDHLATMFPVTRWPIRGVANHAVIFEMWKAGTLRQFYRELFAFDLPRIV